MEKYIILDTNILFSFFKLNNSNNRLLKNYLDVTKTKLILPSIVFKEMEHLYKTELIDKVEILNNSIKDINKLLNKTNIDIFQLDVDKQVQDFCTKFKSFYSVNKLLEPNLEIYNNAIHRSINKIKPCNAKGEEIRDCLIWLTILDFLKDIEKESKVIFISNDKNAFLNNNTLHDNLKEDITNIDRELTTYNTISVFFASVSEPIVLIEKYIDSHLTDVYLKEIYEEYISNKEFEYVFSNIKELFGLHIYDDFSIMNLDFKYFEINKYFNKINESLCYIDVEVSYHILFNLYKPSSYKGPTNQFSDYNFTSLKSDTIDYDFNETITGHFRFKFYENKIEEVELLGIW